VGRWCILRLSRERTKCVCEDPVSVWVPVAECVVLMCRGPPGVLVPRCTVGAFNFLSAACDECCMVVARQERGSRVSKWGSIPCA
jgi:hypothetical protein